nr:helix-turn-helix domain-containing protein [Halomonas socia]
MFAFFDASALIYLLEGKALFANRVRAEQARHRVGVSQSEFAKLIGVSVRTFQEWEQGRRMPTSTARTLLRVATQHPEALRDLS